MEVSRGGELRIVFQIPGCDFHPSMNKFGKWEETKDSQNLRSFGPEFAGRSRLLQYVSWKRGGKADRERSRLNLSQLLV